MGVKLGKIITGRGKRVGRGYGSGKGGHTVGRGQKGQKTRAGIGILFEGFKVKKSFVKRLPMRRGKAKFAAHPKPEVVNLAKLVSLPEGTRVTLDLLVKRNLVDAGSAKKYGVKILGKEKTKKKLIFEMPKSNA